MSNALSNAIRRQWTVSGMDCAACTVKVTKAVECLPGVSNVKVALISQQLSLNLVPATTDPGQIEEIIRRLGYGIAALPEGQGKENSAAQQEADKPHIHGRACTGHDHGYHDHAGYFYAETPAPVARSDVSRGSAGHLHDDQTDRDKKWHQTDKGRLMILTGVLLALAWAFELLTSADYGYWAFVLVCLIGVAPVAKRAFTALCMAQPFTVESLMTIAAVGALFIGAAEEAALVAFLFAVGELLEGVAAGKARDSIRALANLVPKTTLLEEGGKTREVSADSLEIDQKILVRPGDRIPADGEIAEGTSSIDESPVIGESVPVTRGRGEPVYAGSINTEAALCVVVTKAPSNNTIARINRLVEEAEDARAPTERFTERFSRWYMPAIVALAVLVVLIPPLVFVQDWSTWVYRGLTLLLIGCPCALVISVPASIASSLSSGARKGLLMKSGAVIEAAAGVKRIAFDKTGTLTHGKPRVTDIIPAPDVVESDLMAVAAGVEAGSSHPLAQAILHRAAEIGVEELRSTEACAFAGKGVEAMVGGAKAWVASPRHALPARGLSDDHIWLATDLESEGKTVIAVFRERQPLGLIALRDEPREDAADAMRQLKAMGISPVILTGDNSRTAESIAGQLGMDFRAEMMPEDKLSAIREMGIEGGVMMIGDGINDAPALRQASVGVAMGSGADVALETADAAILHGRLANVPALIRLARATMSNIRQNVTIALGFKAVFLVTSVLGITGLWIAILAETGATVLVTLNALWLLRFDPSRET